MTKKLLITDSFFITEDNVNQLQAAGYEVTRLERTAATEDELIEALKGVSVYILGGVEQVTDTVLNSVTNLEAILFPGVDYQKFIPATEVAHKKGIKLLNAPASNASAVAEFAVGTAIAMQRNLFDIGRTGDKKFLTTKSIENSVVGIVGAGNIGLKILESVTAFNPSEFIYYNRSPKDIAARQVDLEALAKESDIIFVCLPMSAGQVFDADIISKLKQDSLTVSISPLNLFDFEALFYRLQLGEIRCAIDWPAPLPGYNELPLSTWFNVNSHSAYNTIQAIHNVNEVVTETAIKLFDVQK